MGGGRRGQNRLLADAEGHPRITPDLEHQREEYGAGAGGATASHSPTGEKKGGKSRHPLEARNRNVGNSLQLGFAGMERRLGA